MKVSSITGNSIEVGYIAPAHDNSLLDVTQNLATSIVKIANQIGTSIALGEKGDLDAAHEFRKQTLGKK